MRIAKNTWVQLAILCGSVIAVVVFALLLYSQNLKNNLRRASCSTLTEIMQQQKFNFDSEMASEVNCIELIASSLSSINAERGEAIATINRWVRYTKFEHIAVVDTDGLGYSNDGNALNISHGPYFQRALQGDTNLSEPVYWPELESMVIPLAAPIYRANKVVGVAVGIYSVDKLSELLLPSYNGAGYVFIVNSSGEIIVSTRNDYTITHESNLFHSFESATFSDYDTFPEMRSKILAGEYGHISYRIDDKVRFSHYAPLNYNGWYIFVVVPEDIISANAKQIVAQTATGASIIIALFIIILAYLSFLQVRSKRERDIYEHQLECIAYTDELTGAATLMKFKIDAQQILDKHPEKPFMLIKLDIDKFKLVNQIYDYSTGDRLLCAFSDALREATGDKLSTFARVNTDEFVLMHEILPNESLGNNRRLFLQYIASAMGDGFYYSLKVPTGRYLIEPSEARRDISDCIEKVNFAHRQSKLTNGEVLDYNIDLMTNALRQKDIENKMEQALKNHEFKVYLQPKYSLSTETINGAEALVRWQEGDNPPISPQHFIPLFEKNGFITKLDFYVFEQVCRMIRSWQDASLCPVAISVNFSRNHLGNPKFVEALCRIADQYNVPHGLLEIEITETAMLQNETRLIEVFRQLHATGFTLSMDDFGTGYSSLGLLKNIPVDVIKIDRNFFVNADNKPRAQIIISIVMKMAHELGIHTVAEGIETKEYADLLRTLGCDMIQGYYYAKPMPEEEFFERYLLPSAQTPCR